MKTRIAIVLAIFVTVTGATAASSALPRYKLKPGTKLGPTLRRYELAVDRTAGFTRTSCWMYDGNARIGWRHGACVGTYTFSGTAYRFKMTTTPMSCSKERRVFASPGTGTQREVIPWKHKYFDCGLGQ